jgi:hypothetical protein
MADAQLFEVEGDERRHGLPNLVTAEGAHFRKAALKSS